MSDIGRRLTSAERILGRSLIDDRAASCPGIFRLAIVRRVEKAASLRKDEDRTTARKLADALRGWEEDAGAPIEPYCLPSYPGEAELGRLTDEQFKGYVKHVLRLGGFLTEATA